MNGGKGAAFWPRLPFIRLRQRRVRSPQMERVNIQSTSRHSADCSDIVIRDGQQVRLVFRPQIVDNPSDSAACVRGRFLYQRKGLREAWEDFDAKPLSSLKKGEQFQLEIKAGELLSFLHDLAALYRVHGREGVPQGRVEFLKIEQNLATFLRLGEAELNEFLSANQADAIETLRRVLKWIAERPETADQIATPEFDLTALNALVGLANLRAILKVWTDNSQKDEEESWQKILAKHTLVLSQLFAYPVVVIKDKAYVGGKRVDNRHGNLVDFLCRIESSRTAVLVEIKTPQTSLLGGEYRQTAFPPSRDLSGAISQVLEYRESLMHEVHTLAHDQSIQISAGEPRCVIIAGNAAHELTDDKRKRSFERFRERVAGVTILTFDEVFSRIDSLLAIFESSEQGSGPIPTSAPL
jgi:hypothetical protein